ncbi:MAG: PAS domain S-box protein [Chloroflexota bacterium]
MASTLPAAAGGLPPDQVATLLDTVFDPCIVLACIRDLDGAIADFRVLAANHPACTGMGIAPSEVIGASLGALLTDDERVRLLPAYRAAVETGSPLSLDAVALHYPAAGGERRFDVRAVPAGDGLSVTWREVTALWRERQDLATTKAALQESEQRFRMIAELSADFVIEMGAGGRILWVSPSVTAAVGWLPDELIGRTPQELVAEEERTEVAGVVRHGFAGQEITGRRRFLCKDGSVRWVHRSVRPVFAEDGSVRRAVAGFRIIQAEVEAEAAVAASEEHFRLLADNASDIVFRSGPDGTVRWVSPSIREVLGWDPDEIVGRRSDEFCHPDDLQVLRERTGALADGSPIGVPVRLRHKEGTYRWIEIKARPVLDAAGTVIGRVGGLRDITAERDAEDALRASETRFRQVVSGLLSPLVILRPLWNGDGDIDDFVFEYANPAACAFNELTLTDTLGRRFSDVVPGVEADGTLRNLREVMETGEVYAESDVRRVDTASDGGVRVRVSDSSAFRLGDVLVVTWRDTTAEHAAQAALRESESRYRLLADNVSDIVFMGDPAATITWVSPSVRTVLGWEPEELVGMPATDLVHPDDLRDWQAENAGIDQSGHAAYDVRYRARDGSFRWMSVATSVIRDARGGIAARTGIARDIAQEHAARIALEASRADLAEAQRVAHVGSWTWAPGDAITWSAENFRILGLEPGEVPPSAAAQADLYVPESRVRMRTALGRTMATGEPFEEELDVIRPDGTLRHLISHGESVRGPDGGIVLIRGTTADVTELKEAELRIRELNEGLEQRVRERTEELETFTYTLSHDLRAPLRWINGFAAMLQRKEGDRLDETSRHYLDEIRNASDRMGRLFEELLDYSRLGRYAVHAEVVDWAPIVAGLRGTFGPRVAASGATLDIAEPLAPVVGDAMLLERLLANLVDNGLTYTAPGTAAHVTIAARQRGHHVALTVRDTGIGIPPDQQERIFHPFVRLHDDEVYPGTGIGLAIVARAARLLGGEIALDSSVGAGSTFTLELPAV